MNFIKSILPNCIFGIALLIEVPAKILSGLSVILYNVAITLHILLGTETGKQLKEMEKSVTNILTLYANINKQVAQAKAAQNQEGNKLANIIKDSPNVVQLGKKKSDDETN